MKPYKLLLIIGIFSMSFILLTLYFVATGDKASEFSQYCFLLHAYPAGMAFTGANTAQILLYYLVLWGALTVLFFVVFRVIKWMFKTVKAVVYSKS